MWPLLTNNGEFRYRNIVFLLGAGASYDHGYPLVNEFLSTKYLTWLCDQCEAIPAGADIMLPEQTDPLSYALDEAKSLSSISENFEAVLSECFSDADRYKRVLAFTNWLLASAWSMVHSTDLMSTAEYLGLARMLLDLNTRGESCVVTFNYDTSAEDAVSSWSRSLADLPGYPQESIYFNYGFRDPVLDVFPKGMLDLTGSVLPMTYPNGRVLILKLHGSINVKICEKCAALYYSSLEALSLDFMFQSPDLRQQFTTCKICGGSLNIMLIPPGKRKNIPTHFKQLWDVAEDRLVAADLIVVGGYSMPDYDEEARDLLQDTLKDKEVLLVDPFPRQATIDFLHAVPVSRLRVLQQGFSEFLRYEMNAYAPGFLAGVAQHCKPVYLDPHKLKGHPRS